MAATHVAVAPDGAGKYIDAQSLISTEAGTPTVDRQTITVGDPTAYGSLAGVSAAGNLQTVVNAPLPAGTNTLGTVKISFQSNGGTITAADTAVAIPNTNGIPLSGNPTNGSTLNCGTSFDESGWQVSLLGTWVGTVWFEQSFDAGANFVPVLMRQVGITSTTLVTSATANGFFRGVSAGATNFRVRCTTLTSGTIPVQIYTAPGSGSIDLVASLPAGTNKIGTVDVASAPAVAKGTQGGNALPTQAMLDSGRTPIMLTALATASVTAEALLTLSQVKGIGATPTTGTGYTVTAGKSLRIQSVQISMRPTTPSTTVTFANISFRLRAVASGGTLSTTSPVVAPVTGLMATNLPTPDFDLDFPDGLELPSGTILGLSHVASATTVTFEVSIIGFEY